MGNRAASTRRAGAATSVSGQAVIVNAGNSFSVTGATISSTSSITLGVVTPGQTSSNSTVTVAGGPIISNVQVTYANFVPIDDNAVSTSGGYILITGSNFSNTNLAVYVGGTRTVNSFVNSTAITANLSANTAGPASLMIFNANAGAIYAPGVTYSGDPIWTTGSYTNSGSTVSVQLLATGDAPLTYSLQPGSSLPTNVSLSSSGLLSGNNVAGGTYSFTVVVDDAQNQSTQQAITLTVVLSDTYFPYTSLLISGQTGVNTANNNVILDSSTSNLAIVKTGNVSQGSFSPFALTGWSNYFNGASSLVSATNAAYTWGTGDYTIEMWYMPMTSYAAANGYLFDQGSNNTRIQLYNNYLRFYYNAGATELNTGTAGLGLNVGTWYHVAAVRYSGNISLYVNGTRANTVASAANETTTSMRIGQYGGGSNGFTGYISNFRAVKGTAVYTANFTPSTTALTAIANTSILTAHTNRFVDRSTNNFALTVTNAVVEAFSPFSPNTVYTAANVGGSAYFDSAASSYLNVAASSGTTFGSGDFTIESWFYYPGPVPTGTGTQNTLIANQVSSDNTTWDLQYYNSQWRLSAWNWTFLQGAGSTFVGNSWNHIAVTRSGTTGRMFLNGNLVVSNASMGTNMTTNAAVKVGWNGSNNYWLGYVSGTRLLKGTALYTANFSLPSAPPTAVSNTSMLLNYTNAAMYDAHGTHNAVQIGDTYVSTAAAKYGTSSMYFDGVGDYLELKPISTTNSVFGFNTGNFTVECWYNVADTSNNYALVGKGPSDADDELMVLLLSGQYYVDWGSASNYMQGGSYTANTWHHFALVRNGANLTVYHNGVSAVTVATVGSTAFTNAYTFKIGMARNGSFYMKGYISDFRVTTGYARYTANFTPPSAALPGQ